jgi:hypothetical protein
MTYTGLTNNRMETPATPPCTYMESVGSDGGGSLGDQISDLLEGYQIRLDAWRVHYLHKRRRWSVLYYTLLCVSICCTSAASVLIATMQASSDEGLKWVGVSLTLLASASSALLAALHPSLEVQKARVQAGLAVKLRGKIFVFLAGCALMSNSERQISVQSIVDGYSKFIEGIPLKD